MTNDSPRLFDIILSAGHVASGSHYDPGAVVGGKEEALLVLSYRDELAHQLRGLGFRVITPRDDYTLKQTIDFATQFKVNTVTLELHFNVYNGSAEGVEAFFDGKTKLSKALAKGLVDSLSLALGQENRGVKTEASSKRGKLGLLRSAPYPVILEIAFMDNPDDMEKVGDIETWAEVAAQAIHEVALSKPRGKPESVQT